MIINEIGPEGFEPPSFGPKPSDLSVELRAYIFLKQIKVFIS